MTRKTGSTFPGISGGICSLDLNLNFDLDLTDSSLGFLLQKDLVTHKSKLNKTWREEDKDSSKKSDLMQLLGSAASFWLRLSQTSPEAI